jgi:ABC-type uncharacterized transport system substrate-binding protein
MHCRIDRRSFLGVAGLFGFASMPRKAAAQSDGPRTAKRVGLLIGDEPEMVEAFKGEFTKLGYRDGVDLVVEVRVSRPNSADARTQAAELTSLTLDVIVAAALPQALQLRAAEADVRMVITTCPGMVSNGFAASLEHPGGNVTGMDELPPGVTERRLKLLKSAVPTASRIALLSTTPGRGGHETQLAEAERTAAQFGISVKAYRVTSFSQLQPALSAIVGDGMDGLLNFQGGLSLVNRQLIVDFANQHRLPAIYQATLFAEAGGLMAWAPDLNEQFRIAARTVDKIFKGAKPGDLPIQYPDRYYLTFNAATAKAIGLVLAPDLLAQADRVLP